MPTQRGSMAETTRGSSRIHASSLVTPGAVAVGQFEDSGRQPFANDLEPGQARFDRGHVLIGKAHLGRAEVFLHARQGGACRRSARWWALLRSHASATCATVAPLGRGE
jgi:hypothetical protein